MTNMNTTPENQTAVAEIQTLMDRWLRDVKAADIDKLMSHYAPDVLAFDAALQLQFKGTEAYGKHWRACMEMCPGPVTYEMHQLQITAGEDVAFAHYLNRCGGIDDETGEERAAWMRGTGCFRRIAGNWKIVHEHFSAPFDMETFKALLDLKP